MYLPTNASRARTAFSRADLLVVIAVLVVLSVVRLSSLGGTRSSSNASQCADNLRRIMQAWVMYADDHSGTLAPLGSGGSSAGKDPSNRSFLGGWLDFTGRYDNINPDLLVNREKAPYGAHLGEFLRRDVRVFRCPDDPVVVTVFGRPYSRIRSVSGNNWMGGAVYCSQSQYRMVRRLEEIIGLEPANSLVVVDERPDSVNDSWFAVDMLGNFVDFPSYYHDGAGTLGFADGHVEQWTWQDPRTITPVVTPGQLIPLNVPSPANADLDRLRSVASLRR
ncbi:MAG TPA: hypothetical protein DCY13_12680 [Verrucomicrobiales bacterium]|nr:hypothetical protein [Verrucomicrobiales bacterium]